MIWSSSLDRGSLTVEHDYLIKFRGSISYVIRFAVLKIGMRRVSTFGLKIGVICGTFGAEKGNMNGQKQHHPYKDGMDDNVESGICLAHY